MVMPLKRTGTGVDGIGMVLRLVHGHGNRFRGSGSAKTYSGSGCHRIGACISSGHIVQLETLLCGMMAIGTGPDIRHRAAVS